MSKLLWVLLFSATSYAAEYKEVLLSECNVYPTFKKEMVRYLNNGPSMYGSWYYDLYYKKVRTIMLLSDFDKPLCDKPIQRTENLRGPHFQVPENHGTAASLAKDVMAFIASHEVDTCPPSTPTNASISDSRVR